MKTGNTFYLVLMLVMIQQMHAGLIPVGSRVLAQGVGSGLITKGVAVGLAGYGVYNFSREFSSLADKSKDIVQNTATEKSVEQSLSSFEKIKKMAQDSKKWIQDKFQSHTVDNNTQQAFHHNVHPDKNFTAAQAANTAAQQGSQAQGFLNFPKNNVNNYTTVNNHFHYAPKGWAEKFFEWVKEGGQNRSAAAGFLGGGIFTYLAVKLMEKKHNAEQEKLVKQ